MINRTVHIIFEPSGQPIPTEEEVQFEAQEIVNRCGWGRREAVARYLMELWQNLVRDKDEQTYYYDTDGDVRYCWMDAEYDFGRIIRRSTNEQVDLEQAMPAPLPAQPVTVPVKNSPKGVSIIIQQNNAPIYIDSHVTIH